MSTRFKGAEARWRTVRGIINSPHPSATRSLEPIRHRFKVGDRVRVKRTGLETVITRIASWGDYEVVGVSGYYSGAQLEPL